jgi:hypothetical protein
VDVSLRLCLRETLEVDDKANGAGWSQRYISSRDAVGRRTFTPTSATRFGLAKARWSINQLIDWLSGRIRYHSHCISSTLDRLRNHFTHRLYLVVLYVNIRSTTKLPLHQAGSLPAQAELLRPRQHLTPPFHNSISSVVTLS